MLLLLLVLSAATGAVQLSVISSFALSDCSGNSLTSWPFAVANQCRPTGTQGSVKNSCSGMQLWDSSSSNTCSGTPSTTNDYSTYCTSQGGNSGQVSFKYECKEYDQVVVVTLQYAKCSETKPGALALWIPLNTCVPAMTNPGGPNYNVNTPVESYLATKRSNGAYSIMRYYSQDCSGSVASFPEVANGACVNMGVISGSSASSLQSATVTSIVFSNSALSNLSTGLVALVLVLILHM
ncbi:hypothetical protein BASA81_000888 [Batrachochytrium salamandrivorans]|nr:hypothetical protein BASA81_000888 [Batrachochytrium salamandrivorans]